MSLLRRVLSTVLFAIAALIGVIGVHKYIFGDFPKLWLVRGLPWHLVNPYAAFPVCLVLASLAARVARGSKVSANSATADQHDRLSL